ncbi:MAG TPA: serine hydrolase domain-containing protein [Streptosporangiaceae bacterium]|nr:serine hydrolase domain-containing protein [Streptosporangiaceae bacterium]
MVPALTAEFLAALAAPDEPGLAVGIYRDGQLVASACAGCAVPEHGVPITEHTAFDIASVSKHVTSACLLLLADDGLVDLDADIRGALPELALAEPVTLRQCLTHTAGLRDYGALCEIAGVPVAGLTEDRFMDLMVGQRELDFPPGSAFSYSNTGYALAAVLVRRVTGGSLADFAAERVFGPLGMARTHVRDDVSLLVPHLADGYLAAGDGFRRRDVTEELTGDGAIVTTVADLARWHSFMTSGEVLGAGIRDRLLDRCVLTGGTKIGYALGLESIEIAGHPAWWHSGSWAGYRAAVLYLPGQRAGVSVLANRNDFYATNVAIAVARAMLTGQDATAAYAELCGLPADRLRAEREAAAIAGLWHDPDQDIFAEFAERDGQLALAEPGWPAYRLGSDGLWHGTGTASAGRYASRDGGLGRFWGPSERLECRFERVPPMTEPARRLTPGIFRNEELRANAEIRIGRSGTAEIAIGLARPRRLAAAADGAWRAVGGADRGGGTAVADAAVAVAAVAVAGVADAAVADTAVAEPLTVRVADGGRALLVSVPRARRVRFELTDAPPPAPAAIRGLSGLAR